MCVSAGVEKIDSDVHKYFICVHELVKCQTHHRLAWTILTEGEPPPAGTTVTRSAGPKAEAHAVFGFGGPLISEVFL